MMLVLRRLRPIDEHAFLAALTLTAPTDPNFAHYHHPGLAFLDYLAILERAERGVGLPEGHVPSTLLFGFVGDAIVGRLMLRHTLNDFLLRVGGHIGYVVVPEHRGRGWAGAMLKEGLVLARSLGLPKVLLTCDEDNLASRRTIERCGGAYEDSCVVPGRPPKRRYWIRLSSAAND